MSWNPEKIGDPKSQLRCVSQILNEYAKPEMGFLPHFVPNKETQAYVYVVNGHVKGIIVGQRIAKANKYLTIDGLQCISSETYPVKFGITHMWVKSPCSHKRVSTQLLNDLCSFAIPDEVIPTNMLAFVPLYDNHTIKFIQNYTKMLEFHIFEFI